MAQSEAPAGIPDPGPYLSARRCPSGNALLGRDADLIEVLSLLDSGLVRLLTLTGPGGVGKTRLAEAIVARLEGDYADGAVIVPLAALQDPHQVLPAVAQAWGLGQRGGQAREAQLASALHGRHALLFLDNFEHLLDPAPVWLGELIAACPRLTVLVTSRIPLRLSAEQRYPVAPLATPGEQAVERSPSVALFVQRARAVRPIFRLDETNAEAVAELCRQLDGLPLAIELAAARCAALSPAEILARLGNRLDTLGRGPRDAPPRHQTLRAAIAWSYDLLAREDQRLFRQLTVFAGGFSLDAAEAVCEVPEKDVLDGLGTLIEASLVATDTVSEGTTRYTMLETIRQFGAESLANSGDEDAVRDRHATWCLQRTLIIEQWEDVERLASGLDLLAFDHANFHVALGWLEGSGAADRLLNLVNGLDQYWLFCGHEVEGLSWYRRALELVPDAPTSERLDALLRAANLAHGLDDSEADDLISQAGALAGEIGTFSQRGYAAFNVGTRAEDHGNYAAAEIAYREGQEHFRQDGSDWDVVLSTYHLGVVALGMGDLTRAVELLEQARAVGIERRDPFTPLWALTYLILIACERGDLATARDLFRQHPDLDRMGYHQGQPMVRAAGAVLASLQGDHERAARLFGATAHEVVLYHPERDIADRAIAQTRLALGDDRYGRAWEQGLRFSQPEVEDEIHRLLDDFGVETGLPAAVDERETLLSRREDEVLRLMAEGLSNRHIADALFISHRTVANHVANIMAKLDVPSRTAAVAWAIRLGLA